MYIETHFGNIVYTEDGVSQILFSAIRNSYTELNPRANMFSLSDDAQRKSLDFVFPLSF